MKNIIIGLISIMLSDIVLGLSIAKFRNEIDRNIILESIFKMGVILVSSSLVYLCGYLNPEILAINMGGVNVSLIDALKMIYIGAIMFYGYRCIKEISILLKVNDNFEIRENDLEEDNIEVKG